MRVDHSTQAKSLPHSRLRGRRSLESFRMSIAERELKEKTTLLPRLWPPRRTYRGPTMLAPPRQLFYLLIKLNVDNVPSGPRVLNPQRRGKVNLEKRGLNYLPERDGGATAAGVGNTLAFFLPSCFPPAFAGRRRLRQQASRTSVQLCRILGVGRGSFPKDKVSARADSAMHYSVCHLASPSGEEGGPRSGDRTHFLTGACLPPPWVGV